MGSPEKASYLSRFTWWAISGTNRPLCAAGAVPRLLGSGEAMKFEKCAHCGYDGKGLSVNLFAAVATLVVLFVIYLLQSPQRRSQQDAGRSPEHRGGDLMSDYPFYENCLRCDKPVSDAEFNRHNIRVCDKCRPHYFLIEPSHQSEPASLKKHLCIQLHLASSEERVQNLLSYIQTLPTTLSSFEGARKIT